MNSILDGMFKRRSIYCSFQVQQIKHRQVWSKKFCNDQLSNEYIPETKRSIDSYLPYSIYFNFWLIRFI